MKPYSNSLPGFTVQASLYREDDVYHFWRSDDNSIALIIPQQPVPDPDPDCIRLNFWGRCGPCHYNSGIGACIYTCYTPDYYSSQFQFCECKPDIIGCSAYCEQRYRYCCPNRIGSPGCCGQYRACCAGF